MLFIEHSICIYSAYCGIYTSYGKPGSALYRLSFLFNLENFKIYHFVFDSPWDKIYSRVFWILQVLVIERSIAYFKILIVDTVHICRLLILKLLFNLILAFFIQIVTS